MIKGLQIQVTGKVQGVWFRGNTQLKAQSLKLTGWVCNKADGTVLMHVFGENAALTEMQEWCKEGPIHARVDHIIVQEIPFEEHSEFVIRR